MAVTRTAPELRPLGVGEILDAGFKIYKARFKTLSLCVLVPVVPLAVLNVLLTASLTDNAFDPDPAAPVGMDGAAMAGLLISVLLSALMALLAVAACTRAVAGAYSGEEVTWQASLRAALGKLAPLLGALIFTVVAVLLGSLLLLLPGLFVLVRLAVVVPALIVEDLGPLGAVDRSWKLVSGRWWATFGAGAIVVILVSIIGAILQGLLLAPMLGGADSELVGGVLSGLGEIVANVFTLPLQAAVITVLYFDLRVRKEGLDLHMLAEQIGSDSGHANDSSASTDEDSDGDHGGFAPPVADGGDSRPGGAPSRPSEEPGR